jgi:predicted unusual protein kinase regulating ubiquinone biosynthesis (AarF/ABC1/UbiB family)
VARAYRRVGVFPPDLGTDEEIGMRLGMILTPMLAGGMAALNISDLVTQSVELMKAYNATAPQELMLVAKQLLYIERYAKVLAPTFVLTADPFIVKNIFPEEAKAKADELGITFPD